MSYLLNPLTIKSLHLSNRLVLPPMATAKSDADGKVNQSILDYYNEKSKGGYISLIIIEHSSVNEYGKVRINQLSAGNDEMIEGLMKLSNVIHLNGSKAIMQINHSGSTTTSDIIGKTPMGASSTANPRNGVIPVEMSKNDILNIIEDFKNAAIRVKNSGYDGVEIHSAHGYLLNQFLSPLTNKRTDEYGGSIYNRIRIHLEIITEVRKAVGEKFPIFLRLGATDYTEGGTSIEDSKIAAMEFERVGVDVIDITGGFCGFIGNGSTEQGYFSSLSEAVKEVVSIPVILTGGVTDINAAEKLLNEGKADLIGVGRAMLNDSEWAKKSIEGLK